MKNKITSQQKISMFHLSEKNLLPVADELKCIVKSEERKLLFIKSNI